jgi:hypothetical protein
MSSHSIRKAGAPAWKTIGEPKLLVIGSYRMGFRIEASGTASLLTVFISPMDGTSANPPPTEPTRVAFLQCLDFHQRCLNFPGPNS